MRSRYHKINRILVLVLALGVVLAVSPVYASEELGGWNLRATGTAVGMTIDEPAMGMPFEPAGEFRLAYTRALLDTGPTGHALASPLWPGPLFGDSMPTVMGEFGFDGFPAYPVRADAYYPAGPEEDVQEAAPGTGMAAFAQPTDVRARAGLTGSEIPELGFAGTISSDSRSWIEDGVAIAETVVSLERAELFGEIVVHGLTSVARASSDGVSASVEGESYFTGLEIAGNTLAMGEDGFHAGEEVMEDPIRAALLPAIGSGFEAVGLEFRIVGVTEEVDRATAKRASVGLEIVIDATPVNEAMHLLPMYDIVGALPEDFAVQLFPLLTAAPEIVITLGEAVAEAAASEAFQFESPEPLPGQAAGAAPAPVGPGDGFASGAPSGTVTSPAAESFETPPQTTSPGPQTPGEPVLATQPLTPPEGYTGLPGGFALLGLLGTTLIGAGLYRLGNGIFTGAAGGCPRGH